MGKDWDKLGGLTSMDDLDLAMLGFGLPTEDEEPEDDGENEENMHYFDMDSIEFQMWMEEEVEKEAARRKARQQGEKTPAKEPKKPE